MSAVPVGITGLRFHDRFHYLRHTAATLAAASGTSRTALMARIVRFLERFGEEPPVPARALPGPRSHATDRPWWAHSGHGHRLHTGHRRPAGP
jgi:hypothetical protein